MKFIQGLNDQKPLYTIRFEKLMDVEVSQVMSVEYKVEGGYRLLDFIFCKTEDGKMYVVGAEFRSSRYYLSHGWWHGCGTELYDIYFRKNFQTREEGNAFYLWAKRMKESGTLVAI